MKNGDIVQLTGASWDDYCPAKRNSYMTIDGTTPSGMPWFSIDGIRWTITSKNVATDFSATLIEEAEDEA